MIVSALLVLVILEPSFSEGKSEKKRNVLSLQSFINWWRRCSTKKSMHVFLVKQVVSIKLNY